MPTTKTLKEEIIEIALENFINGGIQGYTIKQLAETIGISTKTVYKIFANKRALLKACLNTHYAHFFKQLTELNANAENEIETFLNIIHRTVALEFEVNPLFYSELNKYYPQLQTEVSKAQAELFGNLFNIVEKGKKNGIFLPEVNQNVFWIAFGQLYGGITREHLYSELNLSGPELIKNTVLIYLRGICTLKGLQKLQHYNNSES